MFPYGFPTKKWHMPDGTQTSNRPKDGQIWAKWDQYGNETERWQWDDVHEQWFNISSGKPTPQNTKTFAINCPMDLDNLDLVNDSEGHHPGSYYNRTKKCECGSEKVGSPRHSSWCQKYDPAQ